MTLGYTIPGSARNVFRAFESGCPAATSRKRSRGLTNRTCATLARSGGPGAGRWTDHGSRGSSRTGARAKCFTCKIKAQYRRTRRELFPILSRIQNIGYHLGENGRTPGWYRANHPTPWVAGQVADGALFVWRGAGRGGCADRSLTYGDFDAYLAIFLSSPTPVLPRAVRPPRSSLVQVLIERQLSSCRSCLTSLARYTQSSRWTLNVLWAVFTRPNIG